MFRGTMLHNSTLRIIPLEKRYLEKLRLLRNDADTAYYLTSVIPVNEVAQGVWFTSVSQDPTKLYMSILTKDDEFIGIVRMDEWDRINRSIRIGVDIVPDMRRKGYATTAYSLLLSYLFYELALHRVWLLVTEFNTRALSLYKKIGFKEEGRMRDAIFRNNRFHYYVMMSILAKEYEKKK